jgi:hypothetical protein
MTLCGSAAAAPTPPSPVPGEGEDMRAEFIKSALSFRLHYLPWYE